MIPFTPTPLPPGIAPVSIPYAVGIWGASGNVIQGWNWLGTFALTIQVIALLVVVAAGIGVLRRFSADFTKKDAEE